MEVGAVKQAFNNEVILLKKKLSQAKIHVIHKLTRKAKTLTEKKTPDHLKGKLKKKAESAVNEVLIIKKIKARDIAKFIITHAGEVKDYLNRPKVDIDKACARLVLHKSLQDKYKFIRNRFGNVPIKDLFMSRQERKKIKKEEREQQKNKKKSKEGKLVNSAGDWDVEDMVDDSKNIGSFKIGSDDISDDDGLPSSVQSDIKKITKSGDENDSDDELQNDVEHESGNEDLDNTQSDEDNYYSDNDNNDAVEKGDTNGDSINNTDTDEEAEVEKYMKPDLKPGKETKKPLSKSKQKKKNIEISEVDTFKPQQKAINPKSKVKIQDKKVKENKNKNLKEKMQTRKFKKDENGAKIEERKVVDPFFITATGGNYLSLAEPRQPDEVKEVHKQGNRQERRAAMFGHVAKIKPRRDDFRGNNFRSNRFDQNRQDGNDNGTSGFRNNNDRNAKFNDRNAKFNDRNVKFNLNNEKKDEKLHPSWEAKRKLKSMSLLPAQGKKIVFD